MKQALSVIQKEMIEIFQCPGCVCGSNTECEAFELRASDGNFSCLGHVAGTSMLTMIGMQTFYLGLPIGFNRLGPWTAQDNNKVIRIRLWSNSNKPDWNKLNVPVWAMERDGYLFVRTFQPRLNFPMVDVIKGGKLDMCPQAINVGEFAHELD